MSLDKLTTHFADSCNQVCQFIGTKMGENSTLLGHCSTVKTVIHEHPFIPLIVIGFILLFLIYFIFIRSSSKLKVFQASLLTIKVITHDTKVFTFDLPKGWNKIGLNIGQHITLSAKIDGKIQERKYTPISRSDVKRNSFQLLIKVYALGKMSSYVNNMKVGEKIQVSLPYGRFNYLGNGEVEIKDSNNKISRKKYDNFYLVGGGTGITPLYQIIQYVSQVQARQGPRINLLFANRTENDILLKGELQDFQINNPNFKCFFSVDKAEKEGWNGLTGFIDEQKLQQTMPRDLKRTLFAVCGPPIMMNIVEKLLVSKFGVEQNSVFRF